MKYKGEPYPNPQRNPRPADTGYGGDWEQVRHFEPELIEQLYAKPNEDKS